MKLRKQSILFILKFNINHRLRIIYCIASKYLNQNVEGPRDQYLVFAQNAMLIVNAIINLFLSRHMKFVIKQDYIRMVKEGQQVFQQI